ncbi:recombination protein RecR [Candidatus Saccharibacteria bacterium]|nr:recombination protein RecR [Candidatus Saccharibacteria bacterium]MCL1962810.1 recombination protein RecR [Candidatus Saccharibacteria bacterium]
MNNSALPRALNDLVEAFGALPGVGARTAERYSYAVLKGDKQKSAKLAAALSGLHGRIKLCPKTFALIDADLDISPLYTDRQRNRQLVAVVEEPFDVVALENTGQFKGTYHVLGGAISPIDGVGPEQLHIPELIRRLRDDDVAEVILATNASVEGESTALYIQKQIEDSGYFCGANDVIASNAKQPSLDRRGDELPRDDKHPIKITRLARGLPIGVDLEYADQITLSHALNGRREL